jgi:hypothetical protein
MDFLFINIHFAKENMKTEQMHPADGEPAVVLEKCLFGSWPLRRR